MIENFFLILMLSGITFIPILLWGYFFWYIDSDVFQRKRFFLWIGAWGISVFPVLFLWDIAENLWWQFINIFWVVHNFTFQWGIFQVFFSFIILFLLFSLIPFILFYLTPASKEKFKIYISRFLLFSIAFICITLMFYFLDGIFNSFHFWKEETEASLTFGNVVFNSVKLVIFYYLLIGILEELSKFLFFSYEKNFSILSQQHAVINAIFIALWFAFVENILYFYHLYQNYWFGKEVISTYFLRNIFSVFLHILCSSIFAYYFSFLYLKMRDRYNFYFVKIFVFGFFLSFFLHALFDIFVTFNLMFFVFLYIIGGYFYLTFIFYKE